MMSIEFRLYYDERGDVLFYSTEKPEGNYIVIDKDTYAQTRPDLKVIDGKVVHPGKNPVIAKLVHSDTGVNCEEEDISVVTNEDGQKWKLKVYEFRNY